MKQTDVNTIVHIIKELVGGYYAMIYRDTNSFSIQKFQKDEFVSLFIENNQQWRIVNDGDLTRFVFTDDADTEETTSDVIRTFNAYTAENSVKFSRLAVVCDWGLYGLAFDEKQPDFVLELARQEKN